jgi:geranylgeranyl pyrophosphate synthase
MATTPTAADVSGYLAARREEVDRELGRLIPPATAWPERLHQAIRHSLFAGGKRLRPILCLAAGETAGAPPGRLLAPAAALEMIHTYSLIHDDLPAMDDDDLRRGVPTCHVVYGEATAILAGDALLTHGLGTLAKYPEGGEFAAAKIRVLETVVDAIGTRGMIGGQAADMEAEERGAAAGAAGTQATEELVMSIHENKTGRLIRASLAVGGILSGATKDVLRSLEAYGKAVGLAFQIKDDLLDVEADSATLGKAAGKDAAAGKATFPGIWGVERSRAMLREQIEEAIDAVRNLPGRGGRLPDLARFVEERAK